MTDTTTGPFRIVALAQLGEGEDANTRWHTILTVGTKHGRPMAGPSKVTITKADLDALAAGRESCDLPIDVNHAFGAGDNSEENTAARGWIKAIKRVGKELRALVEWTDEGAELIRSKKFRFFSIELGTKFDQDNGDAVGQRVTGGTLVNHPFWDLPALALSEGAAQFIETEQASTDAAESTAESDAPAANVEDSQMTDLKLLSEASGLDLTADNANKLLAELRATADKVDGLETERDTLKADKETLAGEIVTLKATNAESTADAQKYAERIGKIEAELDGEREQRVFDHDLKRNAVSKAEAGTADEPGIARKIYRTDATLYSEGYGARADNHVTGNTTGHDRKQDKPAKDNTNAITEQSAAEVFLCEKADAYAEEHDGVNFTAALAKSVEALGTEGMRLRNLMYGKGA